MITLPQKPIVRHILCKRCDDILEHIITYKSYFYQKGTNITFVNFLAHCTKCGTEKGKVLHTIPLNDWEALITKCE